MPRDVRILRTVAVSFVAATLVCVVMAGSAQSPRPLTLTPSGARSTAPTAEREILVSRQLADQAGVRVGDVVPLAADAGGTRAMTFRVAGVYEPTPDPMKFAVKRLEVRMHLPDLLDLSADPAEPFSRESVDGVNVALVDPRDEEEVASALRARTIGLMVRPTARSTEAGDTFAVLDRFHWAIASVTVVGSTAFLLALMVMRAEERREVIGILRLMGIPPRSILVEVLLEGLFIALVGAIVGVVVAALGEGAVNRFFQWRYDTALVFVRVTVPIAWRSVAVAVPLGVIAGLVASWTLVRRDVGSLVRR